MGNALRLYLRYVGVSVRAQMQYRASFLFSSMGQFLFIAIEFVGVWALFARFGNLPGFSFVQVAFFYGFANSAFAISDALSTGFDRFGTQLVRTGNFDRLLLRPRSTALQVAANEVALKRIGRFTSGAAVLIWANLQLDLAWNGARAALLAFALLGAVCFFCAIIVLQATLSFWTVESLEVMNVLSYGGVEAAQFPMAIYEPWFRRLFTFVVPLGCVVYLPLLRVLDIADPLGSSRSLQALAPLAGPAMLAVSLAFWRLGVRHYTSTGS